MWKTTDDPREAARVDFSFWGKKSEAVVSEERAFILHFLCTVVKVEQ